MYPFFQDVKSLNVKELRSELRARGLNTNGLKAELAARLREVVVDQGEEDEEEDGQAEGNELCPI